MREKFFGPRDIGLVLPQPGPGYLTSVKPQPSARRAPVFGGSRIRDDGRSLWWTPCSGTTVIDEAYAASREAAVEVFTEGCECGEAGLGLAVAEHLARHRGPRVPVGVCSLEPLSPLPGMVRLPHLVHVETVYGERERPVFELLPEAEADAVLGVPVHRADLDFFERHLPQLLDLKRRSRLNGLQDTPAEKQLRELLDESGRYLSIRFVLQHATHIQILIREALVR